MTPSAWRRRRPGLALVGLLAFHMLLLSQLAGPRAPVARAQAPVDLPVQELTDLEQLRTRFNGDFGKLRLVLLLSPT